MNGKRIAVVASHPAHLLAVAGMLQRWRPDVLVLFRTASEQSAAVRAALRSFGLANRLTEFEISEEESYDRALAGDFAFHAALGDRLFDWLRGVKPDVALGDAYELYNYHHDVTRLLVDDAVQRWRAGGRRIENYEFPLACRVDEPGAPVQYGAFPHGTLRALQLRDLELVVKSELVDAVGRAEPFVASAAPLFVHPDTEQYREVPADRDYTAAPSGLAPYYDERGAELVAVGLHAHAITFREHFVPMVRALGLAPFARAAA